MRNLLRFILQFYFTILFVLLEMVALILVFNHNPIQRGYLSQRINSLSETVYHSTYRITGYLHLKEANDQLSRENARLRTFVNSANAGVVQSDSLYSYLPANVINNSVNKTNNYLTLDIGLEDGVEPDMGVIGPTGIIGVIKAVSPNYSRVLSVLNTQLLISVKLKGSDFFGSMVWEPGPYQKIAVHEIPSHADAEPGDTLVTSGYSSIYPANIPVAIVEGKAITRDGNFLNIGARLINDFKRLTRVYVVKFRDLEEIKQLEEPLNE